MYRGDMAQCTAPVRGHRSSAAAAKCHCVRSAFEILLTVLDASFFVPERIFERRRRVERRMVLLRWEIATDQSGRIGHLLADRVALH